MRLDSTNETKNLHEMIPDTRVNGLWFPRFPLTDEAQFLWHKLSRGDIVRDSQTISLEVAGKTTPLDITFAGLGILLISERAALVFRREAKDDIQLIPAKVAGVDEEHYLLNAHKQIDCVDWTRSGVLPRASPLKTPILINAVIERSRMQNAHIFRLTPTFLVVTDMLREAILSAGLVGADFVKQDVV